MSDLTNALARIAASASLASGKQKTFRGCLYGPSGSGKSTIAAMIMRTLVNKDEGTILYIDTSEGWVSWGNHPGLSDGITIIPFTTIEDLEAIADGIKQKIAPFDKVKGVILDEGSKMTEQDVIRVLEGRRAGVYGDGKFKTTSIVTEGVDFQIALERYRKMSYKLYDNRDIHVIVVAHQQDKKDKQGNIISVFPSFSPKIAQAVKEPLHLSAHIVGTVTSDLSNPGMPKYSRIAQVHPSIMVDAKCRMDIRETSVDAETLPQRVKAWLDKGGEQVVAADKYREEVHTTETLTSAIDGVFVDPAATNDNPVVEMESILDSIGIDSL